jgi:phosphopantetheine--protein transferase-like protein
MQTTLLGLTGCVPDALVSPEPALPFQDGNVSLHWSRSHTDGLAVATCLAEQDGRIGIDVEQIVPRAPAFWREIAGAGERNRYGDTVDERTATAIWCAKEATVKALGTGLSLPLAEIEVVALSPTSCQVHLHGKAADAAQDVGVQATLAVTFSLDANTLTAIAVAPRI